MAEKVVAIIVNFGVPSSTGSLLSCLRDYTQVADIIVVDNFTSLQVREELSDLVSSYSGCHVIFNDQNLGYSAAINIGFDSAVRNFGADLLWVLNNDLAFESDVLRPMMIARESWPTGEAIVGSVLLERAHSETVQSAGGQWNPYIGTSRHLYSGLSYSSLYRSSVIEVDYIVGASVLFSRDVFECVGGWDDSFFLYGEDIDFSFKCRNAGFGVLIATESSLVHYEGMSTGTSSRNKNSRSQADRFFVKSSALLISRYGKAKLLGRIFFLIKAIRRFIQGDYQAALRTLRVMFNWI